MTIERAIDVGSAADAVGGATFDAFATGTNMDQWIMWMVSTVVAILIALALFGLLVVTGAK